MGTFVLSPAASEDLHSIAVWLNDAAGEDIARQVIERLHEKCRRLADLPGHLGTPREEIREGLRSTPVPPYVVFFRYEGDDVQVVRILHERQDVGERLDD